MAEPKVPETKALTVTRHLPVKLDMHRKVALGYEEAQHHEEIRRIEAHLKRVTESLKEQIKEVKRKEDICSLALTQGFELKEVACEEDRDLSTNTVQVRRLDTQEIIESRAMTAGERAALLAEARRAELDATTKAKTTQRTGGADGESSAPSSGATPPH